MKTSSKRDSEAPIPEDMIMEILLRLPVNSLLRFKSVSKTWCNLIKTPYFISMHDYLGTTSKLKRKREDDHVFLSRSNNEFARKLSPAYKLLKSGDRSVHVVEGSCHGIVCWYDHSPAVVLGNFATREVRQLPPSSIKSDLKLSLVGVAFGFDSPNIYDFKVLRVFSDPDSFRAEMFTLSSNTWRQIECGLDKELIFSPRGSLFCANSFHFIARPPGANEFTIVCCDVHTERFTTMDFPCKGHFYAIMVLKESLSAVLENHWLKPEERFIEIWIMKDYGITESWTKLYKIGPPVGLAIPLCFWMDDHALLLHDYNSKKLITCNLTSLKLESINIRRYKRAKMAVKS